MAKSPETLINEARQAKGLKKFENFCAALSSPAVLKLYFQSHAIIVIENKYIDLSATDYSDLLNHLFPAGDNNTIDYTPLLEQLFKGNDVLFNEHLELEGVKSADDTETEPLAASAPAPATITDADRNNPLDEEMDALAVAASQVSLDPVGATTPTTADGE